MNKSQFFYKPTAEEIKKEKTAIELSNNLLSVVESLENDNKFFLRIKRKLHEYDKSKSFFRHGKYLQINVPETKIKTPHKYREEYFSKIEDPYYAGYSYIFNGEELRIPLTSCVEGSKLYNYIRNFSGNIVIEDYLYDNNNGAQIIVEIPSRTPKRKNYKFKFISFPVKDNNTAYSLGTEGHNCEDKLYTNISKNSFVLFDDHEIAAYFCLIDHFKNERDNKIPLKMNLFCIPKNNIINLNKSLENKVVIEKTDKKGNIKDYPLTEAEKELFFWAAIREHGYLETFFRTNSKDGLLKNVKWK